MVLPKPVSLNQFYAGRHYAVRSKHKKDYWKHIEDALQAFDKFHLDRFSISVRFNCRYDVDNAICCAKFLADYLRTNGYVDDDTPKYFTHQETRYDAGIEKNTFVAIIKGHGYKRVESSILCSNISDTRSGNKPVRKSTRRSGKAKNGRRKTA